MVQYRYIITVLVYCTVVMYHDVMMKHVVCRDQCVVVIQCWYLYCGIGCWQFLYSRRKSTRIGGHYQWQKGYVRIRGDDVDHTVGLHTGIYSENHLGNDENHNQFMTSMVCKAIFGGNKHGMIQTRCCCFLAWTSGTFYTCRCSTCILLLHYQDEGNIIDIMIGLPQTTTRGSVIWRCGSMLQYSYTKAILKQAAKSQRHQASNNCLIT